MEVDTFDEGPGAMGGADNLLRHFHVAMRSLLVVHFLNRELLATCHRAGLPVPALPEPIRKVADFAASVTAGAELD